MWCRNCTTALLSAARAVRDTVGYRRVVDDSLVLLLD